MTFELTKDIVLSSMIWEEHPKRIRKGTILDGEISKTDDSIVRLVYGDSIISIPKKFVKKV